MSTSSIVTAAIADLRTKFVEAAEDIKPTADVVPYAIHAQTALPLWKLVLTSMEVDDTVGHPLVRFNIAAQAIYHGWTLTGGQAGEFEQAAQLHLILLPAELRARPYFQSTLYASGCGYLAPEGIRVTGAAIAQSENGTIATIAIVTDLIIPLEVQLEEGF